METRGDLNLQRLQEHPQWRAVKGIHSILQAHGFEVYVAGGAVRDLILDRAPEDIDLATSATPDDIEPLFDRVVMVGKAFGVCRVVLFDQVVELATFRKDGAYRDGRRPTSVEFSSPKEDALRRDFTVNGLFFDLAEKRVVDYVGGLEDIERGVLRAIGDPHRRFAEDKLRILRGLRFLSQLAFPLQKATAAAMAEYAKDLALISQERITVEWEKLLLGREALSAIELCDELQIWPVLFEGWPFRRDHYRRVFSNRMEEPSQAWALWFLLHGLEDPEFLKKDILQKWKLPKELVQKIQFCYKNWENLRAFPEVDAVDVALFLHRPAGFFAAEVYAIFCHGQDLTQWAEALRKAQTFFIDGALPAPLLDGKDFLEAGLAPGPGLAKAIQSGHRHQLLHPEKSKAQILADVLAKESVG